MIVVTLVPPDRIDEVWHIAGPMLDRAVARTNGRFRLEDVRADLATMRQTLWLALDDGKIIGCTTIQITEYPNGTRALCYEYLAGDQVSRWLEEGHRVCSAYGRDNGCTILECQGRSGWKPFLEKLGYRQYAVKFEMKIEE